MCQTVQVQASFAQEKTLTLLQCMAVYGSVCSLELKEFLCQNWRRDVWDFFEDPKKSTVKFVEDSVFSKHFGNGLYRSLPKSVEDLVERYEQAYADAKNDQADNRKDKWQAVRKIEDEIANALYDVLSQEWKDIELVEVIASDEPKDSVYDSEDNDEEDMRNSFESLQNPTFYRVYNNH